MAEPAFVIRERQVETPEGLATLSHIACLPLEQAGFINAFSTRLGGVSPLPSNSLNLAYFKGDDQANVSENRRRFLHSLGLASDGTHIVTARQTHSTDVTVIDSIEQAAGTQPACDAMVTRLTGALLGIQTADCLPVLIADTKGGVMAAIHAGWRGTAGRITERAVANLMLSHGVNPRDCVAALGPTACGSCYEVGDDVIQIYKREFRYWRNLFGNFRDNGQAFLDIRAANFQQLAFCGFSEDRIHVADYCTMHQNELFFSYRREAGGEPSKVGRLLSVIGKR